MNHIGLATLLTILLTTYQNTLGEELHSPDLKRDRLTRLERMPTGFGKRNSDPTLLGAVGAGAGDSLGGNGGDISDEGGEKDYDVKLDYGVVGSTPTEDSENVGNTNWKEAADGTSQGRLTAAEMLERRLTLGEESPRKLLLGSGFKRSRLNRMPLSFGKRASWDVSQPGDRFQAGQETVNDNVLIPSAYGEPESVMFDDVSSGASDKRTVLDRMPLSFGKREFSLKLEASEDQDGRSGDKRALLDRMPLSFGKREPSIEAPEEFGMESKRTRLDRMPLSFGKRAIRINRKRIPNDGPFRLLDSSSKRGILDRMPLSFGKRGSAALGDEDLYRELDVKRGILDRMPLSFGKRPAGTGRDDFDESSNEKRDRLDRMPISFGKRNPELDSSSADSADDAELGEKRAVLSRMPDGFGKQDLNLSRRQAEVLGLSKRTRLDRMPLSFGKRWPPISRGPGSSYWYSRGRRLSPMLTWDGKRWFLKRSARLDRMPLTYGKRSAAVGLSSR